MTEYEKARQWRERHKLTQTALGELIGYSVEAIYWFEQGTTPPRALPAAGGDKPGKSRPHPIKSWIWQRYKLACAGADRQLRGETFEW